MLKMTGVFGSLPDCITPPHDAQTIFPSVLPVVPFAGFPFPLRWRGIEWESDVACAGTGLFFFFWMRSRKIFCLNTF
jgi:hypothetical protein